MSTLVIAGDTSGSITLQPASSGSGTLTLPTFSGTALTPTLSAGTATVAPLTFSNGNITTTTTAGNWEYDGEVFYITPAGTQRGLIPTQIIYYTNSTIAGASSTAVQTPFGVGVSLSANTVYVIEAKMTWIAAGATNSVAFQWGFGGTATTNNILYQTQSVWDAGATNTQVDATENQAIVNTTAQTAVTVAAATGALSHIIRGTVSIANAGTFIPQYQWSGAPGSAWTLQIGSYFSVYPVGVAGADISIGTWS
jgi:hypothetical protein